VRLRVQSSMEEFTGSARKAKSPPGYGRIWMGTEVTFGSPSPLGVGALGLGTKEMSDATQPKRRAGTY
jgi:hypothetical protein